MRSARVVLTLTALLSVAILAGCSKDKSSDDSQKIEELTKQVEALNKAIVIDADGNVRLATPTPVAIAEYKQYGFGLPVPSTVKVTAAGVTGKDASNDNGSVLASSGGTSLFLVWNKVSPPLTPQESVVGAFNVLQSLTQAKFEAMGAGQGLTVDNQPGAYGTFVTRDVRGTIDGVGVIGGWVCPNDKRSYAMTVTGKELEPVQQSFVYLTNGFRCEAGKTQTAPAATPTPTKTASPTATAKP
ncbi:MAG: hypothetical protein C4558_04040 [Dehalococcoidia bacterium]|nr:MAG: hypothetical protein C4558_04040 [Dehalococcoidia bacterium]